MLSLAVLAGCASSPTAAPVEERKPAIAKPAAGQASSTASVPAPAPAASGTSPLPDAAAAPAKPLPPGQENLGKPGYYSVKPGDTLTRIALENGQGWRDLARWNGLENANLIEVGHVLRVIPPGVDGSGAGSGLVPAVTRPVLPPSPATPASATAAGASASTPGVVPAVAAPAAPLPPREPDDDVGWIWPAAGPVASGFDEARNNKGLAITGKTGDPVLAAADGRVIYAGSGLRGYGNLVIVKHNATYLTAYAHNDKLLVRDDQIVRKGQKIAEMGNSETDRVQLHFEIRRQGKPIDPARLLPPR